MNIAANDLAMSRAIGVLGLRCWSRARMARPTTICWQNETTRWGAKDRRFASAARPLARHHRSRASLPGWRVVKTWASGSAGSIAPAH